MLKLLRFIQDCMFLKSVERTVGAALRGRPSVEFYCGRYERTLISEGCRWLFSDGTSIGTLRR